MRPLSDHDRTCTCPEACRQRHRHGLPSMPDGTEHPQMKELGWLLGCDCKRCLDAQMRAWQQSQKGQIE